MTPSSAPKLSVCLPTYNRAAYLRQTLSSILGQTLGDFELIVGDNCSTDATRDVIAAVRDPRVRYVRNKTNIGHYRNMNRCMELARGRYLCIVHDDDIYAPEFLACESELLDRHPNVGMVHCAVYVVSSDRQRLRICRAYSRTGVREGRKEFVRYLGGHNVCCSTVMFRRALYEAVGPFNADLMCGDWLMWLQFALRADIGFVATPLVEMRQHVVRMTATMDPMAWATEFLEIMGQGLQMLEQTHPALGASRARFQRYEIRKQGKRFWVAALAAAAEGNMDEAHGYIDALQMLQTSGLPRWYARTAGTLASPLGRSVLRPIRAIRRHLGHLELQHGASW